MDGINEAREDSLSILSKKIHMVAHFLCLVKSHLIPDPFPFHLCTHPPTAKNSVIFRGMPHPPVALARSNLLKEDNDNVEYRYE